MSSRNSFASCAARVLLCASTRVGRCTCSMSQAVVADLPVPVAPSSTTSVSPALMRRRQLGDRLRLVAGGVVLADDLERAHGSCRLHQSRLGAGSDIEGGVRDVSRSRRRRAVEAAPPKPPPSKPPPKPPPSYPLDHLRRSRRHRRRRCRPADPGSNVSPTQPGWSPDHERARADGEVRRDGARQQELVGHDAHHAGLHHHRPRVDEVRVRGRGWRRGRRPRPRHPARPGRPRGPCDALQRGGRVSRADADRQRMPVRSASDMNGRSCSNISRRWAAERSLNAVAWALSITLAGRVLSR